MRDAFARAARRPRKKLTLVHKTNVLVHAGSVWWRLVQEVATEFPDVTVDYMHVDAAMIFMTTDPARFDVIVTDNLFGDIITDLAAAITGGIGLAASGNINPDRTAPSMFEPVHGSAPDIAGQQKADPTAAILSTALLLDHLGYADAAAAVEAAVVERPRRARRRATPGVPPRSATPSLPAWPSPRYLDVHGHQHHPQRAGPSTTRGSPRSWPTPASATHFTDHMLIVEWTPDSGLARRPHRAVRAADRWTRRQRCCTTRRRSSRG